MPRKRRPPPIEWSPLTEDEFDPDALEDAPALRRQVGRGRPSPSRPAKPAPQTPERAAGGLRAKNTRGAFGSSWWGQRWSAVLDSFGWGSRLQRGRTYARGGRVLSLDIKPGHIQSKVRGSQSTPYRVAINLAVLSDAQWAQVLDALAEQALFVAALLAGEMPPEIEAIFKAAGAPLFPQVASDLETSCSCPDFANPCKHIAAVYYILSERFDDDPFLLLHLRGRSKQQLLAALQERQRSADDAELPAHLVAPDLRDQLDHFYTSPAELAGLHVPVMLSGLEDPLVQRFGPPPAETIKDLHVLYSRLTAYVLDSVLYDEDVLPDALEP